MTASIAASSVASASSAEASTTATLSSGDVVDAVVTAVEPTTHFGCLGVFPLFLLGPSHCHEFLLDVEPLFSHFFGVQLHVIARVPLILFECHLRVAHVASNGNIHSRAQFCRAENESLVEV